jgi:hypothetical protein
MEIEYATLPAASPANTTVAYWQCAHGTQPLAALEFMRRAIVSLGLLAAFVCARPALAIPPLQLPAISNAPAATLLLPYFEVDLDNVTGVTTLFSVNNASATAVLAHVVVWSDMGVPVFGYNIYLTGYDVQTINIRDVLTGTVSRTASAGQDPGDQITPHGLISQDINFASCSGILPPPSASPTYPAYLRAALTGGPSSFHQGKCVGRNLGTSGIARGYVTVDTVNNCTLRFPGDIGYFGNGGTGDATNQNVLWGDYFYIDLTQDLGYGDALVHIPASATNPETSVSGQYTFYGRYVNWTAVDNRMPLATNFALRFVAPKDFKTPAKARRRSVMPSSTDLLVWRDSKVMGQPFTCGTTPAWYPLGYEQIRAINEQEQAEVPSLATSPFPAATQRVTVASSALPVTAFSGWLFLDLNTTVSGSPNPPEDPAAAQAWVTVLQRVQQGPNGGRYDVGYRAIRLDSAATANHAPLF